LDTDAIGDSVKNKLKAIRMDNDEFADEDDGDFDDDEELEPITFSFLEKPKNSLTLSRQFFPSKAGGFPVPLYLLNNSLFYTLLLYCFIQSRPCLFEYIA
jgi:pre-rRNA-processing protein TSR4